MGDSFHPSSVSVSVISDGGGWFWAAGRVMVTLGDYWLYVKLTGGSNLHVHVCTGWPKKLYIFLTHHIFGTV